MKDSREFHVGELAVQAATGNLEQAQRLKQMIQPKIAQNALEFLSNQQLLWMGMQDKQGYIWACPFIGPPGFLFSDDGEQLAIQLSEQCFVPEVLLSNLSDESKVGCLAIELMTRRRLRINGRLQELNENQLLIKVEQSYPNCPKYITSREPAIFTESNGLNYRSTGIQLDTVLIELIGAADTAFVASCGPDGLDVSHRGGEPGFIQCVTDTILLVPDFKGNGLFNTLGNFKTNPYAGLSVVDFNHGRLLCMSGFVRVMLEGQKNRTISQPCDRYWEFHLTHYQLYEIQR